MQRSGVQADVKCMMYDYKCARKDVLLTLAKPLPFAVVERTCKATLV